MTKVLKYQISKSSLSIYKNILLLAFPLLLGQLGNIAVSFADNIMVGHYSRQALASASFVNNIFNIAIFASLGFTYGLTPLIGALFARGKDDDIGRTVRLGLIVNIIFTIILSLLMLLLYYNVHLMGQPEHLLPLIRPYFLTVLAGMLPVSIFNVLAQWSFAINRTGTPTWIILGCNLLNIIGNYILIFGHLGVPELGLLGAGYSTLGSRILSAVVMAGIFFHSTSGRRYIAGFRASPTRKGEIRHIVRTGFPVSMQMAFETASFSGSAVIAGWLGEVSLAAFQVFVTSSMLGFCLYYSIGAAMAIPVSHAQGRGDRRAMRRNAWAGYHLILITMLASCALLYFGGRYIMGLFTEDATVITLAVSVIIPMLIYQLGDASQIAFANALRGTSNVTPMLYIAMVSYLFVGLPASWFFAIPLDMGLYGIVLSFSICLFLAGALYFYFFIRTTDSKKGIRTTPQ